MKLKQFASVIFIQAAILFFLPVGIRIRREAARTPVRPGTHRPVGNALRLHGLGSNAEPVVEIKQHRGTLRRRYQQVFELAERMRTDRVLLVAREQQPLRSFADEDIEVIEPEVGHDFFQLAVAVDRAQKLCLGEFLGYDGLRLIHCQQDFFLPRSHPGGEFHQLAAAHGVGESDLLVGRHPHYFLVAIFRL